MAIWVEMTDRNGEKFRQWRRSSLQEEGPPDDGLACVCCNAHPHTTAAGRLVMTHDFHMHANWKHAIGMGEGAASLDVVRPVRSTFRDWAAD